jgi:hypothetical protein
MDPIDRTVARLEVLATEMGSESGLYCAALETLSWITRRTIRFMNEGADDTDMQATFAEVEQHLQSGVIELFEPASKSGDESRAASALHSGLTTVESVIAWLKGADPPVSAEFDTDSDTEAASACVAVISLVHRALVAHFAKCPSDLGTMDRRQFEELVAELFDGFGYSVELTAQTRDGGKDIIAVKKVDTIDIRLLIECKRPDPGNAISVSAVRELFGVKNDDGATKGILVTTTHFSNDAHKFATRNRWELELKELNNVLEWIQAYQRLKGGSS